MGQWLYGIMCIAAMVSQPTEVNQRVDAYVGARIITVSGAEFESGTLIVTNGKITSVGPQAGTKIPESANRHDVGNLVIIPGLVDTHSHIGGGWGGDGSAPIQPDTRILDSINVRSASIHKARAGGITTVNVMPGSGHLLSGQTLYLKLRDGDTVEDLLIYNEQGQIAGGMKMANGTNSHRAPPFPGTRAKSAALIRSALVSAGEYQRKLAKAESEEKPEIRPDRDLGMESLLKILNREWIVHHHTHRHDDIMTVLRLAREFNLRVVLHHISEGWKVADEIAKENIPCSIIVVDSPGGKLEAMNIRLETPAILEQAGALVAIHTDDPINDSRVFLRSGALAIRAGMTRDGALKALTLNGTRMLDLDQRTGSLEPGKDADFVVLSGDPFSVYTKVLKTYVEGELVFDRSDLNDRLYATGGKGAGEDRDIHDHGYDEWD